MAGNTFGRNFRLTTAGESHGPAYIAIVDGCPAGIALTEADIQVELDRRRPGQSQVTTQRKEKDKVVILSGVFECKTTGAPIGLMIENRDTNSKDYSDIKDLFRPGHADFTYHRKYGHRDYRGGGRSSARETMMRVAAGAIAKKYLKEKCDIEIIGYLAELGPFAIEVVDLSEVSNNIFFSPDASVVGELEAYIDKIRGEGDSIGAQVNIIAKGVPIGLGDPVYDRLDADIAKAMMSINAVKGVEIGDGFGAVIQKGSEHRDVLTADGFQSNHSGGTLGGISSGQDIRVSIALKPTSSIVQPVTTLDIHGNEVECVTRGRHDPCVGIRAVPVAEAMLALTLMDHYLLLTTS